MNKYVIRYSTWGCWDLRSPLARGFRQRKYFKTKKDALKWKREHPFVKAGIQKL